MMMHLPMSLQFQCSLPRSTTRWQCFRPGSLSRRRAYEEAKAALDRAQELAVGAESAAARFPAYYGKWLSCSHRGEMDLARQIAERFLREAKVEGRMFEAAVASRILGVTFLWQGDFTEAKANLEEALRLCDAHYDPKVNVSFGQDTIAAAKAFLAITTWALGEVTRPRELIQQAIARAVETTHAPTLVNTYWFKASLDVLRGDADEALRDATTVIELSRELGSRRRLPFGSGSPLSGNSRSALTLPRRTDLRARPSSPRSRSRQIAGVEQTPKPRKRPYQTRGLGRRGTDVTEPGPAAP